MKLRDEFSAQPSRDLLHFRRKFTLDPPGNAQAHGYAPDMLRGNVELPRNSAVNAVVSGTVSQLLADCVKLDAQVEPSFKPQFINSGLNDVKGKMARPRKNERPRPEWSLWIARLRSELRVTGTVFGKMFGVSAMAVSKWENGLINTEPLEHYIKMATMATNTATRRWFVHRAGLDALLDSPGWNGEERRRAVGDNNVSPSVTRDKRGPRLVPGRKSPKKGPRGL